MDCLRGQSSIEYGTYIQYSTFGIEIFLYDIISAIVGWLSICWIIMLIALLILLEQFLRDVVVMYDNAMKNERENHTKKANYCSRLLKAIKVIYDWDSAWRLITG